MEGFKYLTETLGGGVLALLCFSGKRALNNYDLRLKNAESSTTEILKYLNKLDKKMTRVDAVLEERTRHCTNRIDSL